MNIYIKKSYNYYGAYTDHGFCSLVDYMERDKETLIRKLNNTIRFLGYAIIARVFDMTTESPTELKYIGFKRL